MKLNVVPHQFNDLFDVMLKFTVVLLTFGYRFEPYYCIINVANRWKYEIFRYKWRIFMYVNSKKFVAYWKLRAQNQCIFTWMSFHLIWLKFGPRMKSNNIYSNANSFSFGKMARGGWSWLHQSNTNVVH